MTAFYGWLALLGSVWLAPKVARLVRDWEHRNETEWQRETAALERMNNRVLGGNE